MNQKQWEILCKFREAYKAKIQEWSTRIPELQSLQKQASELAGTPAYPFETPVVYNLDLDKITIEDDIRLIVIGDNPGKDEQLKKNNRYLVGQAGKIADGFFRRNPELKTDFRKNVIILNKTPVHSAKTAQLKKIMSLGGKAVSDLILESQLWMAEKTAELHCNLNTAADSNSAGPELWMVGYSELKGKGFFIPYRDKLKDGYAGTPEVWSKVYVFQHFSMNRFTIDLGELTDGMDKPLLEKIHYTGDLHKKEIFR